MKRKLSTLSQDPEILEIRHVNPVFVSRYRQAMRTGDQFPPLIIDSDNVIISGNHRYEAYCLEYPGNHTVECEMESFDDEAARIERAIAENSTHGNPMDGISRKRAIFKLIQLGRDDEAIADLLGVSVKRVVSMAGQHVIVRGNGKKPVKRGLENMKGKTVTPQQYEQHDKRDRAMSVWNQAEQLIRWLDNGWVDMEEPRNLESLTKLATTLDTKLGVNV